MTHWDRFFLGKNAQKEPVPMGQPKRNLLFRTAKNCYTQKLITENSKNPHPKTTMLTLKRVKEIFPFMEDIEYKVGI